MEDAPAEEESPVEQCDELVEDTPAEQYNAITENIEAVAEEAPPEPSPEESPGEEVVLGEGYSLESEDSDGWLGGRK